MFDDEYICEMRGWQISFRFDDAKNNSSKLFVYWIRAHVILSTFFTEYSNQFIMHTHTPHTCSDKNAYIPMHIKDFFSTLKINNYGRGMAIFFKILVRINWCFFSFFQFIFYNFLWSKPVNYIIHIRYNLWY